MCENYDRYLIEIGYIFLVSEHQADLVEEKDMSICIIQARRKSLKNNSEIEFQTDSDETKRFRFVDCIKQGVRKISVGPFPAEIGRIRCLCSHSVNQICFYIYEKKSSTKTCLSLGGGLGEDSEEPPNLRKINGGRKKREAVGI